MAQSELRMDLVETAIKFLQSPRVQTTPLEHRRNFLQKKGLTEEEISVAVERSGAEQFSPQRPHLEAQIIPSVAQVSRWQRAKNLLTDTALLAGLAYAVYCLTKKYIWKYFFGASPQKKRLGDISDSVDQLISKVTDLSTLVRESEAKKDETQKNSMESRFGESVLAKEVKAEINSLKTLLLSRRQFPPTPVSTPLPTWQLSARENTESLTSQSAVDVLANKNSASTTSTNEDTENNSSAIQSLDNNSTAKTDTFKEYQETQSRVNCAILGNEDDDRELSISNHNREGPTNEDVICPKATCSSEKCEDQTTSSQVDKREDRHDGTN